MVMQTRTRRALDGMLPFVAVGLMVVPALMPLLRTGALPCTHDNMFHTFRLVAMRDMLRHGWLFSRWVPNLALGYGYPFFNYREPLPYLVGEGLFAAGVPLPLVLGLLYAGGLLGAAWGAYVLARDLFGRRAAWVSAAAYGLGPYLLMAPLRRGNMPETVALALLPWLLIVMRRLVLYGRQRTFLAATLLMVALFLSHNISSLLLAPFLGLYVTGLAWIYRDRRTWLLAYGAVVIAVLLAAWFWLPALSEQGWVQLHLSRSTRNNDFHYNFITWREMILSVPAPYDPAYLNPPMRVYLGLGQAALALVGLGTGLVLSPTEGHGRRHEQRFLVALFGAAALAYLWMSTPGAVGVWDRISLLSFVQFPWRMVGRALLPVSLLAGLAVEGLGRWFDRRGGERRVQPATVLLCVVLAGFVVASWPDTYPPKGMCPVEPYPDMDDLYALELSGWIGMDPENSYFPIWVEEHPSSTALAADFAAGRLPVRFDLAAAPAGTRVLSASYHPLRATVELDAPSDFQARWLGLYFPGWEVLVDGVPAMATPEDDTGLLTFPVPAGAHRIDVRFGTTRARAAGLSLSATGGIALMLAVVLWRRLGTPSGDDLACKTGSESTVAAGAPGRYRQTSLIILALTVVLVGVRTVAPVTQSRLDRGGLPDVTTRVDRAFQGGLTLLGATPAVDRIAADEELAVDLLWGVRETPSVRYRTTVLLRDADGRVWSPAGTMRPRGYEEPVPSVAWQPGAYVFDPHIVTLQAGTPPGLYEIVVVAFDAETLTPASSLNAAGTPEGPDLVLGTVMVTAPKQAPELADLQVSTGGPTPVGELQRCGPVGLWSMTIDRVTGTPGDVMAVRWVWEAVETPGQDGNVALDLVNAGGDLAHRWSLPPVASWWPPGAWSPGERWVGQHVVRLPGDLESGAYRLQVYWPGCEIALADTALAVVAPDRAWTVPESLDPADVRFADQAAERIALVGYDVAKPSFGGTVDVTLAWQALASIETSYHVFLHLLDAEGRVVSQSDGVPVGWSRPTTGWAEGEVVVETRQVDLPAGAGHTLRVGLYETGGPRLLTAGGEDGTVLATFEGGE